MDPVAVAGPPVPDAFWLVWAGVNGCGCGALSVLTIFIMLGIWGMVAKSATRRRYERKRRYMRGMVCDE
jgi:hypothetical protein